MFNSEWLSKKARLVLLALAFVFLPVAIMAQGVDVVSQDSRTGAGRAFQQLLRSTYLGHAAELPDPSEPIEVLQRYLEIQKHSSPVDRKSLDKAISEWGRLTRLYPNSRYAQVGLAGFYRQRATLTGAGDLRRAAAAYINANQIGMTQKRILFTRQISELMVQMNDIEGLDAAFAPILVNRRKADFRSGEQQIALIDYADGLAGLKDDRAWEFFQQALDAQPGSVEAVNRYGRRLLEAKRAEEAIAILETLSREQRIRLVRPSFLRLQAMKMAGRDASSAQDEVDEVRRNLQQLGVYFPDKAKSDVLTPAHEPFAHSNASDDCRSSTYAQNLQCDSSGTCLYPYVVNLAEILYNEARGEPYGVWDAVGWTVRDRALQGVSCDVYIGGVNYTSCRTNLPCGDPSRCALSRYYCCVEHGNTTAVGTAHSQFNDAHVSLQSLIDTSILYEAMYVWQGRVPDPTTGFAPSGVSGCTVACDYSNWCSSGSNYDSPSPNGPMEYLGYNYCAANQTCKTYKGNVCGNNTRATSCTSGGSGDNYFWNRRN